MADDRAQRGAVYDALCDAMTAVNQRYDPPAFIPPTAIGWLSRELADAAWAALAPAGDRRWEWVVVRLDDNDRMVVGPIVTEVAVTEREAMPGLLKRMWPGDQFEVRYREVQVGPWQKP